MVEIASISTLLKMTVLFPPTTEQDTGVVPTAQFTDAERVNATGIITSIRAVKVSKEAT